MGTQTPKAAGSKPPSLRTNDNTYAVRSVEKKRAGSVSSPSWPRPLTSHEAPVQAGHDKRCREHLSVQSAYSTPDVPQHLAQLLEDVIPGHDGQKLAEAFRDGSDLPPITRQSLSELDIQNIIMNIRLRHDVNFDRDLSFRPNLDGTRGQEKVKSAQLYWKALVAELELYNTLFHGTHPLPKLDTNEWSNIVQHAERRIPTIFETIQDVLKSLVPERDHSRVDEHLDVEMLMRQIERGICDLVGLSEWMSSLLKEHCAPMRDQWVDKMVSYTRTGVTQSKPESIVKGLCELLGILESMKLDVANHQIRNLKTILIEDTVGFETHYHLDKLVHGRARVNVQSAQAWYQSATQEFASICTSQYKSPRLDLEVFVRGITASLFGRDGRSEFPDTTYLDTERLQLIKAEIEDHVFFEVCLDMFAILLKQFGYQGPSQLTTRRQLVSSLIAIMGEPSVGYGLRRWTSNSEALSLEILRQASKLAGRAIAYDHDAFSNANQLLRQLLFSTFTNQARNLEAAILPTIMSTIDKHNSSSPMELFNNLVPNTTPSPLPSVHRAQPSATDTFSSHRILYPDAQKLLDITNRISHLIILHWRIWSKIAYVQEGATTKVSTSTLSSQAKDSSVPSCMKTGEAPEIFEETHVAYGEPSQ